MEINIKPRDQSERAWEGDIYGYEIWCPQSREIYQIVHSPVDRWEIRNVPELGCTSPNSFSGDLRVTLEGLQLKFCYREDDKNPLYHVVIVVRVYANQPRDLTNFPDQVIPKHVYSFAVLRHQLGTTTPFVMEGLFNSDVKWIHKVMPPHATFTITDTGFTPKGPTKDYNYWNSKLRVIWDEFVKPEIDFAVTSVNDVNILVPPSICVNGIDVYETFAQEDCFRVCKGLSVQSFFRAAPIPEVDEDWLCLVLEQVLNIRNSTTAEFISDCEDHFVLWGDDSVFRECQADVVRVATIHVTTWPYVSDRTFENSTTEIMGDSFDADWSCAGDCEDKEVVVMRILSLLLEKSDWKTKAVNVMRQCVALLGLPVGISGKSRSPMDEKEVTGHMFGACLPFPILHHMITKKELNGEELEYFKSKFGFKKKANVCFPKHIVVLEAIMMGTPYYFERRQEDLDKVGYDAKQKKFFDIMAQLPTAGEKSNIIWRNYTLKNPFGYGGHKSYENGFIVHQEVTRLFTFNIPLFYRKDDPELAAFYGRLGASPKLQGSFLIRTSAMAERISPRRTFGIKALDFFKTNPNSSQWDLTISTAMTNEAWEAEEEIIRSYIRPIVPLSKHTYEFDALKRKTDASVPAEWYTSKISKNPHRHLQVYAWGIDTNTTNVIKSLAAITSSSIAVRKYGHGHMFVLNW